MILRILTKLTNWIFAQAKLIVILAVSLTIFAGIYAQQNLRLNADYDDLVSEELAYHQRYKNFLKEFGDQEYLYIVVDAEDSQGQAKPFVRALANRLQKLPEIRELIWKVSSPALEKSFLLYLEKEQLAKIGAIANNGSFSLRKIKSWQTIVPFFAEINAALSKPMQGANEDMLEQGFVFLGELFSSMQAVLDGKPASFKIEAMLGNEHSFDMDGYLKSGKLFFIMIMPQKDFSTMEVIAEPLAKIRKVLAEVKADFPEVKAGLTGRPVLAADEMISTDKDMRAATTLAIILVGLLFIIFFRSFARPILAMCSLLMGIAWTFAFVALCFGELNILSIVFALILVGAAIEYAIHLVARYQEELVQHQDIKLAITNSLTTAGRSNLTSACTTAAAFLTIMWTDFSALAQLGAIAASGIMFCLFAMLIVLPALLVLRDGNKSKEFLQNIAPFKLPALLKVYQRPKRFLLAAVGVSLVLIVFIPRVEFDNNLLNLQATGLESVEFEHLIIDKSNESTWFANIVSSSKEVSLEKAAEFRKLKSVRRVDDISTLIPLNQAEKIKQIKKFAPAFARLKFKAADSSPNIAKLRKEMLATMKNFAESLARLQEQAFTAGRYDAVEELELFLIKVNDFISSLQSAHDERVLKFAHFQREFLDNLKAKLALVASGMHPQVLTIEDLPSGLTSRFVSSADNYALTIYPANDIWHPKHLQEFVNELRSVDENVLGTPIEVYESARLMRTTFLRSACLAFLVIIILVWLDFRSLRVALMAVLPLGLGTVWLLGLMGLFAIPFNMANFFAIPILIGIGVDSGVHLVHRLQRDRELAALSKSTGKGVLLTVLANAVGFGMMMIATHQGLASLGKIMAIGSLTCLIAALFVMPPIAARFLNIPLNKQN